MFCRFDALPDFAIESWPRDRAVMLCGTGMAAQIALNILSEAGIEVTGFVDHDARHENLAGLPVTTYKTPSGLMDEGTCLVIVNQYWVKWAGILKERGFHNTYNGYESVYNARYGAEREGVYRSALALAAQAALRSGLADEDRARKALDSVIASFKEIGPLSNRTNQCSLSMLSPLTHAVAQFFIRLTNGPVVEIGPYVGGLTVSMARGREGDGSRKIISVERGGQQFSHHPTLPTADILADLQHNVAGMAPDCDLRIAMGQAQEPSTVEQVAAHLGGELAAFMVLDSDGDVHNTFEAYRRFARAGCIIMIDDFMDASSDPAINKSWRTRTELYRYLHAGMFEELIIVPHGTWFGVSRIGRTT